MYNTCYYYIILLIFPFYFFRLVWTLELFSSFLPFSPLNVAASHLPTSNTTAHASPSIPSIAPTAERYHPLKQNSENRDSWISSKVIRLHAKFTNNYVRRKDSVIVIMIMIRYAISPTYICPLTITKTVLVIPTDF